ncbi:MAG: hypothetical protein ACI4BB_12235 [Coprococcus sp.]
MTVILFSIAFAGAGILGYFLMGRIDVFLTDNLREIHGLEQWDHHK